MCKKTFINVLEFILLVLGMPMAMVIVVAGTPILGVIIKLISLNPVVLPAALIFILVLNCGVAGGILVEKNRKYK